MFRMIENINIYLFGPLSIKRIAGKSLRWITFLFVFSSFIACSKSSEHPLDQSSDRGSDGKDTTEYYTIRAMTYNIEGGKLTNGNYDLNVYADIINEMDPDIVAICEIGRGAPRINYKDQVAELAKLTGMKGYFGRFRKLAGGDWGDAILSKFPVLDIKVIPANSALNPTMGRSYMFAKVKIAEDKTLYFNCSHLDPYVDDQKIVQAKELIHYYLDTIDKAPMLICGDLNARPDDGAMKVFFEYFEPSDPHFAPTHNVRKKNPSRKLDYILYPNTGDWKVSKFKRNLRKDASDHAPILSVLKLKK